jgi:hypothetical protein
MTGWPPERLPVVWLPAAGEGLDSWLEGYARRLRVCSADLLTHLGLPDSGLERMVTILTGAEQQMLSAATGLDGTKLTAMTLRPWDGVAVNIDPARRLVAYPPAWRRAAGSRYCPACLRAHPDRWQLAWRLPWAFACTVHACLLTDTCPACGRRPVGHRPGTRAPASLPGRCPRVTPGNSPGGSRGTLCGQLLSQTSTLALPAGGLIVTAQRHIDRLLAAAATAPDSRRRLLLRRTLTELHTLAYKALAALHTNPNPAPDLIGAVLAEAGGHVPARHHALDAHDAHTVAVGTAIAVAAHRPDPTGQDLLAWLLHIHAGHCPDEANKTLKPFTDASQQLTGRVLKALDPTLTIQQRLTYATTSRRPRPPTLTDQQVDRRAAALPALLWPAWAIRLIPAGLHAAPAAAQAALAALTLVPGSRLSTTQAAAMLGGHARHPTDVLARLPDNQRTSALQILTGLADSLDARPTPIDYTRRRDLFPPAATSVDRGAYAELAAAHQWNPPSPLQLRLLDGHLVRLLTGTHPDAGQAGPVRGIPTFHPLTLALPRPVRAFVHAQAQELLQRHGIREPVTWHPTPPAEIAWPGIDPADIDAARFARAVADHAGDRLKLAPIRRATGLGDVHIRLYAQLADHDLPDDRWNDLAGPAVDLFDPARLHHLYVDLELPLDDIARLCLTTQSRVKTALAAAGITVLPCRPRTLASTLTPQWFADNYLGTPDKLAQAAVRTGYSRDTLRKHARRHGIPTDRGHDPHHPLAYNPFRSWPHDLMPPAEVVAACGGPHGLTYVRQVLTIPAHPTRRSAAAALGIHEAVLLRHRKHVEQAAGIQIFLHRTGLTPEGQQFLDQAAHALHALDQTSRRS